MQDEKLSGWARVTLLIGSVLFLWTVIGLALYGAFRIMEKFL